MRVSKSKVFMSRLLAGIGCSIWAVTCFLLVASWITFGLGFGLLVVFGLPLIALMSLAVGLVFPPSWSSRTSLAAAVLTICWLAAFPLLFRKTTDLVDKPPSDNSYIAPFQQREPALQRIVQLLSKESGIRRVDLDWSDPAPEKSSGEQRRLQPLIRKELEAAQALGAFRNPDGSVYIFDWRLGSVGSSHSKKGYAYCPSPPTQILPTLDQMDRKPGREVHSFRHLQGNWYVFYTVTR